MLQYVKSCTKQVLSGQVIVKKLKSQIGYGKFDMIPNAKNTGQIVRCVYWLDFWLVGSLIPHKLYHCCGISDKRQKNSTVLATVSSFSLFL